MTSRLHVNGVGFWSPGFTDVVSWRSGQCQATVTEPTAALLNPRIRRRTSLLTRMSLEAAEQAARQAGGDLATVPSLFASAYGEANTSIELLEQLHSDTGALSPIRFHNSVHNTASGYFSIACQNRSFSTSIAAGWQTLAMALLETWALLSLRGGDAVLVLSEESLPPPLDRAGWFQPLAIAFYLSATASPRTLARLGAPHMADGGELTTIPEPFRGSPAGPALPLLAAVLEPTQSTTVRLEPGAGTVWSVDVCSPEAPSPSSRP